MELDKHIIDKINDGHREIVRGSKDLVRKAIIVGEEIIRAREIAGHGEFGKLIDGGLFDMKKANVYNYIKVAEYSAKVQTIGNLQEAYKLIESEESKKKQAEQADQRQRIQYRVEHNEKPRTWQRSDDYAWKKYQDEQQARDERIKAFNDRQRTLNNSNSMNDGLDEELAQAKQKANDSEDFINDYLQNEQNKLADMQNLKITNQNGSILQLIESYLANLDTDSQRIEECYNLIKYCKDKAIKLQQNK